MLNAHLAAHDKIRHGDAHAEVEGRGRDLLSKPVRTGASELRDACWVTKSTSGPSDHRQSTNQRTVVARAKGRPSRHARFL